MKELRTAIEIHATPERVWDILSDTSRFPEWNPFIQKFSGTLRKGTSIEVFLKPADGGGMTIRPRLLKVEPSRELRWLGHLWFPGIFDGEHIFEIEPLDATRVRFVQREEFNGILIPFFNLEGTRRDFEAMNRALKERAEAKDSDGTKTG